MISEHRDGKHKMMFSLTSCSIIWIFLSVLFFYSKFAQTSGYFLVSAREYVCTDTNFKLITDAWSVNDQLLYLRLNHYGSLNSTLNSSSLTASNSEVDTRLIVYDRVLDRFLNIYLPQDRFSLQQAQSSGRLADVISVALIKSFSQDLSNQFQSPSPLFFNTRNQLRANCQSHWLYDPPSSGFCRRHPIVNSMGRVLAIVRRPQGSLKPAEPISDYDLYRATIMRNSNSNSGNGNNLDGFGSSTVRPVITRWSLSSIQDELTSLITTSVLALQLNHNSPSTMGNQALLRNIRFLFSNKLGLFISWLPAPYDPLDSNGDPNCAILLPVKLQPTMRMCSRKYSFLSILEIDQFIYILLPENRILKLSHDYLVRQYRLHNNLDLNLDLPNIHEPRDAFETLFRCSEYVQNRMSRTNETKLTTISGSTGNDSMITSSTTSVSLIPLD